MKLITRHPKVAEGIKTFLKVYPQYNKTNAPFYNEERYNKVSKLNTEDCTVAQFNEAIGCTHWTDNICDECQGDFDTLVRIGSEPDYGARWQCLCKECLLKAVGMLP